MRFRPLAALAAVALLPAPHSAWSQAADPFSATGGAKTCGPVTKVLSAVGDEARLDCPGAAGYVIQVVPVSGQSALTGTIISADSVTTSGRRFYETGISTQVYNGTQGIAEYRTIGGGYGQSIRLTAVTSGQASVTILGSYQPAVVFGSGAFLPPDDVAIRQKRAYTVSTGRQAVTNGQYLSLDLANPSSSLVRQFITSRTFTCDDKTNVNQFSSASNPTATLATTTVGISSRSNGPASGAVAYYQNGNAHSDLATPNPLAAGGYIGPGNAKGELDKQFERVLDPGNRFTNWIGPMIATANCQITFVFYEETVN